MNEFLPGATGRLRLSYGYLAVAFALLVSACGPASTQKPEATQPVADAVQPIDANATEPTRALLHNLHRLKEGGVMFGHQDSLAYGVEWWSEDGRSDVKGVTGDYPAVYGWEIGDLELGAEENLDGVNFADMQGWMKSGYQRGGVITISWHMNHPQTEQGSWITEPGAGELLPGGAAHHKLKAYLDTFAEFVSALEVETEAGERELVPVIFRPWHEHNGDWFWWGTRETSEQEYIQLWRFTVEYLRDEKGVHNLLYAFSPDRSRMNMEDFEQSYFYAYPGDDYVDILGFDNYWDLGHGSNDAPKAVNQVHLVESLEGVARLAAERNKVAALTEAGQDTLHEEDFWTQRLLPALMANEWTRQLAYAQVWRNANRAREQRDHFYVPYPGHPGIEDFIEFYEHPATLFEADLPDMYRINP
ncbi:glycoside hydrolase family 26 protein [Marinimicrobium sp. ABcell2]|uniref:glycoside hydrolase family 26 protein n=1 Tax=Marinimicrobium sp. ABcell2 TaxID=3069751 RepID=UPI0027B153D9|nr:glycosyl hydrolase [Marinimicrobium sp. ABcell2]MDQ2075503.1 glycosyl hydrolase [Marinimicrobium sp. ABcell2]